MAQRREHDRACAHATAALQTLCLPAMRAIGRLLALPCLLLLLSACGDGTRNNAADAAASGADANLPKPEATRGSVTGMPDTPGPGPVGPPPANPALDGLPSDTTLAGDDSLGLPPADGSAPAATDATAGAAEAGDPQAGGAVEAAAAEPTAQDAVAVVREYYAALDARQPARARALWVDAGRAGTSPFADGFAEGTQVSVELRAPGRVDAAAGSRYIQLPVAVRVSARDGSVRRYVGTHTLQRAVVAGASAEQRAWRIVAADLREVE